MRSYFFIGAVFLLACAAPRPLMTSAPSVPPPAPEAKDFNCVVIVSEAVPDPRNDGLSYTKVFVDGVEMGRTALGRKSQPRQVKLKLRAGNRLLHLEQWILPGFSDWIRLDDTLQPRERFVRVEDGMVARLELRFAVDEGSNALTLTREGAAR